MLRRTAILLHTASLARALTTSTPLFSANAAKKLRPSKDDVDRISWGKPSKKKGVGSRGTPHRLNEAERAEYDRAKSRGYVEVAGSAWRKERRDAPLLNTWRNWCDAVALPSISVQKWTDVDLVIVDLSPLRRPDVLEVAAAVRAVRKSNFGRSTPSTRCCLRSCVCSMAWSFQAIDATLSPRPRRLDGVEVHEGQAIFLR